MYCACGSGLVGEVKTKKYLNSKSQKFYYFGCKSRKRDKQCSKMYIRMEELEIMVSEFFKGVEFTEEFKEYIDSIEKSII